MDFKKVYAINVNEWTEKKNGLTYLSWANAWAKFVEIYPCATYEILKDNGIPYFGNEKIGYMVYTRVTVEDLTHEMWLPVMDNNNKTMKFDSYTYDTKFKKDIKVEAIDMFAVNKAIMRCLTKNLAMFGFGLYIYAGEDVPNDEPEPQPKPQPAKTIDQAKVTTLINKAGDRLPKVLEYYKVKSANEMTLDQWKKVMAQLEKSDKNEKA